DGYGDPRGHLPLREWIRDALAENEIALQPEQVLLTHGSSHALDLAIRRLVRTGDAVLVDDPGYSNLLFALRVAGARLVPVPRTPQGYDLAALEEAIAAHHPRVFFTQPRLQSPTTSIPTRGPRSPASTSSRACSTSAATRRRSRPTCASATSRRTRRWSTTSRS